jgi:hypothetical protein
LSVPAGAHVNNVGNSSGYLRGLLLSRRPSLFIRQGRSLQRKVEQRARGLFLLGEPLAPDLPADEPLAWERLWPSEQRRLALTDALVAEHPRFYLDVRSGALS